MNWQLLIYWQATCAPNAANAWLVGANTGKRGIKQIKSFKMKMRTNAKCAQHTNLKTIKSIKQDPENQFQQTEQNAGPLSKYCNYSFIKTATKKSWNIASSQSAHNSSSWECLNWPTTCHHRRISDAALWQNGEVESVRHLRQAGKVHIFQAFFHVPGIILSKVTGFHMLGTCFCTRWR